MATASVTTPFVSFIRRARHLLAGPQLTCRLHVVLGNEAADADSIVSSMTYAYYLHSLNKLEGTHIEYIPLIGANREDMVLRRDTEQLLSRINLRLDDVTCIDEFRYDQDVSLSLVDHNALSDRASESFLGGFIVENIFDHHKDSGMYEEVTKERRVIAFDESTNSQTVASTCTLVVEQYLAVDVPIEPDIALLLTGVIALDSLNMDSKAGRGTEVDRGALNALSSLYPELEATRSSLYTSLSSAKSDPVFWASLSAKNALRLDSKVFSSTSSPNINIAISSVLLPIHELILKDDFNDTINSIISSSSSDCIAVVMGVVFEPSFHREILICASANLFHQVTNSLISSVEGVELDLEQTKQFTIRTSSSEGKGGGELHGVVYEQNNSKISRKQLAPVLQKITFSLDQ